MCASGVWSADETRARRRQFRGAPPPPGETRAFYRFFMARHAIDIEILRR